MFAIEDSKHNHRLYTEEMQVPCLSWSRASVKLWSSGLLLKHVGNSRRRPRSRPHCRRIVVEVGVAAELAVEHTGRNKRIVTEIVATSTTSIQARCA